MPVTTLPFNRPGSKEACTRSLGNVVDALYVLGGKWKLPVVLSLMQAPKRFNEIQADLGSISAKILAKELKDLELNELVRRTVLPGTPATILYEATEYSETLKDLLAIVSQWGAGHRERVRRSLAKRA